MCPADFLRLPECTFLATEWSLFLSPCRLDGRCGNAWWCGLRPPPEAANPPPAGLLGEVEFGELEAVESPWQPPELMGGDDMRLLTRVGELGAESTAGAAPAVAPDEEGRLRLKKGKLRDAVIMGDDDPPAPAAICRQAQKVFAFFFNFKSSNLIIIITSKIKVKIKKI